MVGTLLTTDWHHQPKIKMGNTFAFLTCQEESSSERLRRRHLAATSPADRIWAITGLKERRNVQGMVEVLTIMPRHPDDETAQARGCDAIRECVTAYGGRHAFAGCRAHELLNTVRGESGASAIECLAAALEKFSGDGLKDTGNARNFRRGLEAVGILYEEASHQRGAVGLNTLYPGREGCEEGVFSILCAHHFWRRAICDRLYRLTSFDFSKVRRSQTFQLFNFSTFHFFSSLLYVCTFICTKVDTHPCIHPT